MKLFTLPTQFKKKKRLLNIQNWNKQKKNNKKKQIALELFSLNTHSFIYVTHLVAACS